MAGRSRKTKAKPAANGATRIYLMVSPLRPFKVKIGISNNVERRTEEVQAAWALFDFHVWFAYHTEQALHRVYSFIGLHSPSWGSGKTEWFWCVNPLATGALWYWFPEWFGDWWFVVFFLPVPIDLAAILYALFFLQRSAVIFFLVWVIKNFPD